MSRLLCVLALASIACGATALPLPTATPAATATPTATEPQMVSIVVLCVLVDTLTMRDAPEGNAYTEYMHKGQPVIPMDMAFTEHGNWLQLSDHVWVAAWYDGRQLVGEC